MSNGMSVVTQGQVTWTDVNSLGTFSNNVTTVALNAQGKARTAWIPTTTGVGTITAQGTQLKDANNAALPDVTTNLTVFVPKAEFTVINFKFNFLGGRVVTNGMVDPGGRTNIFTGHDWEVRCRGISVDADVRIDVKPDILPQSIKDQEAQRHYLGYIQNLFSLGRSNAFHKTLAVTEFKSGAVPPGVILDGPAYSPLGYKDSEPMYGTLVFPNVVRPANFSRDGATNNIQFIDFPIISGTWNDPVTGEINAIQRTFVHDLFRFWLATRNVSGSVTNYNYLKNFEWKNESSVEWKSNKKPRDWIDGTTGHEVTPSNPKHLGYFSTNTTAVINGQGTSAPVLVLPKANDGTNQMQVYTNQFKKF